MPTNANPTFDPGKPFKSKRKNSPMNSPTINRLRTFTKNLAAQYSVIVKTLSAKVEARVAMLPKEYLKTGDKQD